MIVARLRKAYVAAPGFLCFPNSESFSFPFERLPRYSEANSWPGGVRCLTRETYICPIRHSRRQLRVPAGSRYFTTRHGLFMSNVPSPDRRRS